MRVGPLAVVRRRLEGAFYAVACRDSMTKLRAVFVASLVGVASLLLFWGAVPKTEFWKEIAYEDRYFFVSGRTIMELERVFTENAPFSQNSFPPFQFYSGGQSPNAENTPRDDTRSGRACNQLPYSDVENLHAKKLRARMERGEALEFSHSLNDQIGGQLEAGFLIAGFYEDSSRRTTSG